MKQNQGQFERQERMKRIIKGLAEEFRPKAANEARRARQREFWSVVNARFAPDPEDISERLNMGRWK